jgi:hypothetical protein
MKDRARHLPQSIAGRFVYPLSPRPWCGMLPRGRLAVKAARTLRASVGGFVGKWGGILRKAGEQMMRSSPCIEVAYFEQVALIRLCLLIRASSPYLA